MASINLVKVLLLTNLPFVMSPKSSRVFLNKVKAPAPLEFEAIESFGLGEEPLVVYSTSLMKIGAAIYSFPWKVIVFVVKFKQL